MCLWALRDRGVWMQRKRRGGGSQGKRSWGDEASPVMGRSTVSEAGGRTRARRFFRKQKDMMWSAPFDPTFPTKCISHLGLWTRAKSGHDLELSTLLAKMGSFLSSQYPVEIRKYEYDPGFAIRGLHYDVQRVGLILMCFCSLTVFGNKMYSWCFSLLNT